MEIIRLPKLGMTMESGEIAQWLVKQGEAVKAGEVLLMVTTDKVDVEVHAAVSGVLAKILADEGATLDVGAPIAVVAEEGERLPEDVSSLLDGGAVAHKAEPPGPPSSGHPGASLRVTPRVRKLAAGLGVALANVNPTGSRGTITEDDVRSFAASPDARPDGQSTAKRDRRRKLGSIQRAMSRHMAEAWRTIPHIYQMIELDAAPLRSAHDAKGVPLTPFLVRAVALALERHPEINARLVGESLILLGDIHVSVAVAAKQGLFTPVIRHANQKSLADVARDLAELTAKAQEGGLSSGEIDGGTFTLSNLGMYGIESGTPIINSPQLALLFVGAIRAVPVVGDGAQVRVGQRCHLTFAYDHRVIDGVTGARFTQEVRQLLERPDQL